MNKSTKIWLNYTLGGAISLILLWSIYGQVTKQLAGIDGSVWQHTGPVSYLICCIALMFANTSLEGYKWHLLTRSVEPLPYWRTFSSYLAGVAFSIITPNRIGEYPGRILYLGRSNTFRYINVAILGSIAQLSAVYLFGLAGLIYYNILFPALAAKFALGLCAVVNVFLFLLYWRFESILPSFERYKWLRRFIVYSKLLNRITTRELIRVLFISFLRFVIFTAQYLFLLRWMNVQLPLVEGFCMGALFFWVMAVIPSIALTELGIRGSVSIYIFRHFSADTIGILAATAGIWVLNLIIPSIIGSTLILRMRLLR